ncbi:hypothetical protein [Rhodococcus sp. BE178]|uniref:hypothetical protein n=1 Tax=Rhodococcus sp. BE178 TaxID=2817737 RepID=UPI003D195E04
MPDSTRDRLIEAAYDAIGAFDDSARDQAEYVLDVILDALHPEVTTAEEASRLIEGTVIRDHLDNVGEIRSARGQLWIWWICGNQLERLDTIAFPARVLHRPDTEENAR